jgi:K+-sensing histidine kinase KdpD
MRERLVVTLVAMTVGTIVVFGAIRAYTTANLVRDQEHTLVAASADLAAIAVASAGADRVTAEFLQQLTHGRQTITWVAGDGTTISTRTALRDDNDISATRKVAGSGGGRLILTQEASVSSDRISSALSSIVAVGIALAALAALIGWILAARFARPFHRLAADATRIGQGHFDTEVHHSYMREAAELGNALRSAAGQLDTLVRRERELAVVASHELRTPITSLRLSLEDLTMWPETPPQVAEELHRSLGEVDRLSAVVTTLLEGGNDRRRDAAATLDLSVVAAEAVQRWSEQVKAQGRVIVLAPGEPSPVKAPRAAVEKITDVLIKNALQHGAGRIVIEIFRDSSHFRFRVADEGPRTIEPGVLHASTMTQAGGLAYAAAEAESLGGFIGVTDQPTTLISLVLPRADRQRRASDAVR